MGSSSQSTLRFAIQDMHPAPAPRSRVGCPRVSCWMRCGGFASNCRWWGSTSLRGARHTTTLTSLSRWQIEWSWRLCVPSRGSARTPATVRSGTRCSRCSVTGLLRFPREESPHTTTLTWATIRRRGTAMSDTVPSEVPTDTGSAASFQATGREISVGTDAAYAQAYGHTRRPLRNISEVRHFFRTNEVPIYFVGATPFNLLGLDRWGRSFSYVTYYDGWNGAHPRVFTPRHKPYIEFESGEEINNWLLVNPGVRAHMSRPAPQGQRPKVAMVFFDAETERICEELGYDLILPSAELREHLDSKIVTTRLGDEVGAASVPNVLVTVDEYDELLEVTKSAGLGTDLVIQTAYGDSGKTTFFIDDESGWKRHQDRKSV